MNNNNYQNIIKRIDVIRKELGISGDHDVTTPGSIKDIAEQILDKITSNSNSTINGKIIDLYNKMNNVYYDLASSSTSYTKGKVNDLYTKFNNIYNELNSTSTSYMKGKVNSIYNNILNNQSDTINIHKVKTIRKDSKLKYRYSKRDGIDVGTSEYIEKPDPIVIDHWDLFRGERIAIIEAWVYLKPNTLKFNIPYTGNHVWLSGFSISANLTYGNYSYSPNIFVNNGVGNNFIILNKSDYLYNYNHSLKFEPIIHEFSILKLDSDVEKYHCTAECTITSIVTYYTI